MTEIELSEHPAMQRNQTACYAVLYLSNTRGLYIGPAQGTTELRQATPLILLGLQENLTVNGQTGRSFLVKPGKRVEIMCTPGQLVAAYLPDRNNLEYQTLLSDMRTSGDTLSAGYRWEEALIEELLEIIQSPPPALEALTRIINLVSTDSNPVDEAIFVYPRAVTRLMTYIRLNPIHTVPLESIARMEKTDVNSLRKQFEEALGVSVQGYQTWRRIYEVAYKIFTGSRLEEAAVTCGFASEADFNMCFRNFFGMEANRIFNDHTRILMNRYGKTF